MEGRIGRYQLVKRLAAGGMADIWLAHEHGPRGYERTVVVKTIRADLVDEADLIQMLVEEARIAACLRHQNIVQVFEVGEEGGTHYLAMEFVFGRDLRQIRDRCLEIGTRIPDKHVVTIISAVLDALFYAYNTATYEGEPLRVVHRDVSPQNIIVGFDGSVRLLDFGIAKATAQLSRTRSGVLKGKYGYMAPEQVDFEDLDERADLFSAGVVLWEMLTQHRLFYRETEYETVQAVLNCKVPFPSAVRPEIAWPIAWITYRALFKNPRWRYRTAAVMRSRLLAWDGRSREQAHDELAGWVCGLYNEELRLRENTLISANQEATTRRKIMDAGFELIEEPTRNDRSWEKEPVHARPRTPAVTRSAEIATDANIGFKAVVWAMLASWKWFLVLFGLLLMLGLGTGVYIASIHRDPSEFGILNVTADTPNVEVWVGAHEIGKAPVSNIRVLSGRHEILGVSGGRRVLLDVEIPGGGTTTVELRLREEVAK